MNHGSSEFCTYPRIDKGFCDVICVPQLGFICENYMITKQNDKDNKDQE